MPAATSGCPFGERFGGRTYRIRYERVGLDRFGVDVDVHNDNTYGPMVLMLMLILMLLMLMVVHDDIMIIVRQSCACFFPDIVAVGQGVMSEHFPRVY